jgi:hypothetical protein
LRECLHGHKNEHGAFPEELSRHALPECFPAVEGEEAPREIRDFWGNSVFYASTENAFVLVGFGKGGKPEREDYGEVERWAGIEPEDVSVCGTPTADLVQTHRGFHSRCGK